MAQKKYASLSTLQTFLENLKNLFATKAEMNKKADVQIITQDNTETTTEDISTLKIHKLSQEQYDELVKNGTIDETALYLTPDEEIDLTPYVTIEQLDLKADYSHAHDDIYYTETEMDAKLAEKSDTTHNHNDSYDAKGSAEEALNSAKIYTDEVKNDLLSGAGTAYDTLKELGDLIDDNTDAIDALEIVAAGKADKVHLHTVSDIADLTATATELNYMDGVTSDVQTQLDGKASSSHTHNSVIIREW